MPEAIVPDDSTPSAEPDTNAAPVAAHRVEITSNYVSVVLDYPGATPDAAYWTWKRAMQYLGEFRELERGAERPRIEANMNGFVTEQATEPPAEQASKPRFGFLDHTLLPVSSCGAEGCIHEAGP
jgi:hypothetical protein